VGQYRNKKTKKTKQNIVKRTNNGRSTSWC